MHLQRSLRLDAGIAFEAIAKRLPDRCREESVVLYARLIARAAKSHSLVPKKEVSDETAAR